MRWRFQTGRETAAKRTQVYGRGRWPQAAVRCGGGLALPAIGPLHCAPIFVFSLPENVCVRFAQAAFSPSRFARSPIRR